MIVDRLGNYQILKKLGAGGMGEVYLAEDAKLGRRVALKALKPVMASGAERLSRFRREVLAVAALNHRNIVTIYTVEEADGVHFFTMELVEGVTLDRLVTSGGIALRRFFNVAIPITEALAAAHERGIAHRDLKPGNIMISDTGQVKILDFGLARLLEPDTLGEGGETADTLDLTLDGRVVGTVPYMSPEQLEGRNVDQRTDIFSLGILLHELATGRRPFRGKSSAQVMSSILRDRPTPVTNYRSDLPRHLGRIILLCLEKDQRRRYQSMLDVRNEIGALRDELTMSELAGSAPGTADQPAGAGFERSIAVLPFVNISPDPENEYFSDGVTEEILNALGQLDGLRVAARTSSFSFKGRSPEVAEVGAKLKVSTVLEGSVRRVGSRLRITAQLIDVADGYHLWSERYDREVDDIFAIQDEIASAIAGKLQVTLAGEEKRPLVSRRTDNIEAYDLYLKGRFYLEQRGEGLRQGYKFFQMALGLDPEFALAHTGVADALSLAGYYSFAAPRDAMPQAQAAARRALELDDALAEPHNALAFTLFCYDYDWRGAAREFRRALELNPACVPAHYWYGFYLMSAERQFEAANGECRKAVQLDPLATTPSVLLAVSFIGSRDFSEVVRILRPVAERDPANFLVHRTMGLGYLFQSLYQEAIAELELAVTVAARHPWPLSDLGMAYAAVGRKDEAEAIQQEMLERRRKAYVQPVLLSQIPLTLGRKDEALDYLEQAFEERDGLLAILEVWPSLDPLRDEPRFQSLAKRLRFP